MGLKGLLGIDVFGPGSGGTGFPGGVGRSSKRGLSTPVIVKHPLEGTT